MGSQRLANMSKAQHSYQMVGNQLLLLQGTHFFFHLQSLDSPHQIVAKLLSQECTILSHVVILYDLINLDVSSCIYSFCSLSVIVS
jgi:hypothetical protein